jgi:hypothetical protein
MSSSFASICLRRIGADARQSHARAHTAPAPAITDAQPELVLRREEAKHLLAGIAGGEGGFVRLVFGVVGHGANAILCNRGGAKRTDVDVRSPPQVDVILRYSEGSRDTSNSRHRDPPVASSLGSRCAEITERSRHCFAPARGAELRGPRDLWRRSWCRT